MESEHRIGRARVTSNRRSRRRDHIAAEDDLHERLIFLGDDAAGRALKVMGVQTERGLLVIHPMDLRAKWRPLL